MTMLLLAAIAFVGTHFLLSHPLRAPLVRVMGEPAFLGVYSVIAVATFIWMIVAYRSPESFWQDHWSVIQLSRSRVLQRLHLVWHVAYTP